MKNSCKKKLTPFKELEINQHQQIKIKGGTEETPPIVIEDMVDF